MKQINNNTINPPNITITAVDLDEQDGLQLIHSQINSNSCIGLANELIKRLESSEHLSTLFTLLQLLQTQAGGDSIWKEIEEIIQTVVNRQIHNDLNQDMNLETNSKSIQSISMHTSLSTESLIIGASHGTKPVIPHISPAPPPPPPSPNSNNPSPRPDSISSEIEELLPQQSPPNPNLKMKSLYWDIVAPQTVLGQKNIWTTMANKHKKSFRLPIEWHKAESLFSVPLPMTTNTLDRSTIKPHSTKLKLLNDQHSFLVEIFLEQFKGLKTDDEIIELVRSCRHQVMGMEKIKRLLRLLSEMDELDILRTFAGNRNHLVRAEIFLIKLIEIPDYKLRLECMAFKEDFNENFTQLQDSMKIVIQAANELLNNKGLHEILYTIVLVGNFLNSGKFGGNAIGIKLSSLPKLSQTRANTVHMNFLHFMVDQIKRTQPYLLQSLNEFRNLHETDKINLEQIPVDIKKFDSLLQSLKSRLELPNTMLDMNGQMLKSLENDEAQIQNLKETLKDVEDIRIKLATFFCEPSSTFKLKDCFKIFEKFLWDLKRAETELEIIETNTISKQKQSYGTIATPSKGKSNINIHNRFETVKVARSKGFIREAIESEQSNRVTLKTNTAEKISSLQKSKKESAVDKFKSNKEVLQKSVSSKIRHYSDISQQHNSGSVTNLPSAAKDKSAISKCEEIGVHVMPVNEAKLQEIIRKLKPVPKKNSLWDIPREKLLRHSIPKGPITKDKDIFADRKKFFENIASKTDNEKTQTPKLTLQTRKKINYSSLKDTSNESSVTEQASEETNMNQKHAFNSTPSEMPNSKIEEINESKKSQNESDDMAKMTQIEGKSSFPKRIFTSIVKKIGFGK
ncbi:FH2 domain-containing protein 1-like [Musca domestica]|uniref:FH2 domain-containing protein 1-like n=1 Tax=Musca domestica TaxID=7370 RepID=A0ABM3VPZ1_MUSDO|nr:FH2 domain-containing protein 1-like [Musca domestica]